MILETNRLEIIALTPEQLRLWTEDIGKLEKMLDCKYRAEPIVGEFRSIIEFQRKISEADPDNYLWYTFWFIVRKSDRTVVGSADFKDPPDENGEVEIGYGLGSDFEHNGYMTETVKELCRFGKAQPGVKNIIAETELENLASQNVLTRCGFEKFKSGETAWWRLRS